MLTSQVLRKRNSERKLPHAGLSRKKNSMWNTPLAYRVAQPLLYSLLTYYVFKQHLRAITF